MSYVSLESRDQEILEIKTDGSIKDYRTEIKKFSIMAEFEQRCLETAGKYDEGKYDKFKEFAESFWKNDYPKIEALEENLKSRLKNNIDLFNKLSIFDQLFH